MIPQRREFVKLRREKKKALEFRVAQGPVQTRIPHSHADPGRHRAGPASVGGRPTNRIDVCTHRPTNCPTNLGVAPTNLTNWIEGF